MYKAYNNMLPVNFQKIFVLNNVIHSYVTRQADKFNCQHATTTAKQNSIKFKGPAIWNALPIKLTDMKISKSLLSFKINLKKYLLNKYVPNTKTKFFVSILVVIRVFTFSFFVFLYIE